MSTYVETGHDYTDATIVPAFWSAYKATAMDAGFTATAEYLAYTGDDLILVDAIIAAQTELTSPTDELVSTLASTGHQYTDSTTISTGLSWANLKLSAIDSSYKTIASYLTLGEADKALVDALITA